jgi:hypothetical protein
MKRELISLFAAFTMLIVLNTSCDKEDDNNPNPTPKTKTQLISSSPWVFQSATASGTDISNQPQLACFKDNSVTFTAAGMYTVNESTNVCSPSTAGTFAWSFQSAETVLQLASPLIPNGTGTFTIVSLNETNLVLSQDVNFPPLTTVVVTFKH